MIATKDDTKKNIESTIKQVKGKFKSSLFTDRIIDSLNEMSEVNSKLSLPKIRINGMKVDEYIERRKYLLKDSFNVVNQKGVAPIDILIVYLSKYSSISTADLEDHSINTSLRSLVNIKKPELRDLARDLYKVDRSLYFTVKLSLESNFFFMSIFNIIHNQLGLENAFKLMDKYIDYCGGRTIVTGKQPLFEKILEATDYCEENSDYPIEWLLESVFELGVVNS